MKNKKLPILAAIVSLAFTFNVKAQENERLLKSFFDNNASSTIVKQDLKHYSIDMTDPSESMEGTIIKTVQIFNNLPIYNATATALVKDGKVSYYNDNFVKNYSFASNATPTLSTRGILGSIANDLNNQDISDFAIKSYEDEGGYGKEVKQRLVYFSADDKLLLAYDVSIAEPKSSNFWNYIVDAKDGKILYKTNLTFSCNFKHDSYSNFGSIDHSDHNHFTGPEENKEVGFNFFSPQNASYNVFKLPIEAASFGNRSVVNNPWILSSSPEGWHSNGINQYTITRGNNVFAYEDTAANNSPSFSPDGGSARNFNFAYSLNGTPDYNQSAAITNLFYMNNMMHDIFYKFGFTETARNFQNKNIITGTATGQNDEVYAEAQDGGGINNANFSSPSNGTPGRMQMFLWSPVGQKFYYNTPAIAIPRTPAVGLAAAPAPQLTATGITADVKQSPVTEGCTALPANSLAGKIGLVLRGNCNFDVKIKNLQNAGAVAAIVYNQTPNTALGNMSITDTTVAIPGVMITNEEATFIIGQITAGQTVNVTLKAGDTPDGDFDNGIIAHEYGHGISNRLTGSGNGCLSSSVSKEQMGEGWSDFFALMLTNKPNATAAVPRGIGTYVKGQANDGDGIRPLRYSPDFTINFATYDHTNGMEYNNNGTMVPDVHSIGFVWATMLWDLHWQYADKYGYASDVTANSASGSARVLQLVMDGLKMQTCNPSFIDGRDAILAAELQTTQGADKCMIWRTFAKRGLGVGASAGLKNNINDQVAAFDVPSECVLGTNEVATVNNTVGIYPNPAKDEFFIDFPKALNGKANVTIYDMSGKLVSTIEKVDTKTKTSISTSGINNGVYVVKIDALGYQASSKLVVKK